MNSDVIRMLRYNTGTDKKAFVKFKNDFDAVIFNATIVAYSGAAVADLVSVHKNQYIIDPQTHILQHSVHAIMSKKPRNGQPCIKKSVQKYLEQLPAGILDIIANEKRPLSIDEIRGMLDDLAESVYEFETKYVDQFIEKKEYSKYLKYINAGPAPRVVIAPYFMLKKERSVEECHEIFRLNKLYMQRFLEIHRENGEKCPAAAQLVMDKEVLTDEKLLEWICESYKELDFEYFFIWINDFSSWDCSRAEKVCFCKLLCTLNEIGKKPVMSYGGYDSIFLCNEEVKPRLYGAAQSVGYGEARTITPVGGGLPVNKYYFRPLHKRMRFDEALNILMDTGYFDPAKENDEHAADYYRNICDCEQCHDVIRNDIDNFNIYNESVPYIVKARFGNITRNRPTQEAALVAAFHFLYSKQREWQDVGNHSLSELRDMLISDYETFGTEQQWENIKEWCEIFAG